jgi:hypothetical protein
VRVGWATGRRWPFVLRTIDPELATQEIAVVEAEVQKS